MYSFLVASFAVLATFSSQASATCGAGCQASLKKPRCVYVTYKNSAYTGKWLAYAKVKIGAPTFSCVTESWDSNTCETFASLSDCVEGTRGVSYNEDNFYACSASAARNKASWCYQIQNSDWDNCIFVTNKSSSFYNRYVIAQYLKKIDLNDKQTEVGTYCWTNGGSKCKTFRANQFDKCQNKVSNLRLNVPYEDIYTYPCSKSAQNAVDGWCYAAKILTA
eukprot:Awhi_evm1s14793